MGLLPAFVAIPLLTALVLNIVEQKSWYTHILALSSSIFLAVLSFFTPQTHGIYYVGGFGPHIGINMMIDPLNRLILIVVQVIVMLACWYSVGYMEHYTSKSRFYAFVFLMLAGMNGIILTADFFNFYVFMEIATLASYVLVSYGGRSYELEASFKYMILGSISSLFMLLGIALIYSQTAALNMMVAAERIDPAHPVTFLIIVLFLAGLGLKSAIFPFHSWLPDAHSSAPAPISAILSGVLIKAVGIYVMLRFVFNFIGSENAPLTMLAWLGVIGAFVGVVLALGQKDLKRLLACSSVSQVGYIFIGIGLGTPLGLAGALLHLISHSASKSLLFFSAGSIEYSANERNITLLGGLKKLMPWTHLGNFIGFSAIGGIPPLSGFWSKLLILLACVSAGQWLIGLLAALFAIMTLSLLPKIEKNVFTGDIPEHLKKTKESPSSMIIPMMVLSFFCLGIGLIYLVPSWNQNILTSAVEVLMDGRWLGAINNVP